MYTARLFKVVYGLDFLKKANEFYLNCLFVVVDI